MKKERKYKGTDAGYWRKGNKFSIGNKKTRIEFNGKKLKIFKNGIELPCSKGMPYQSIIIKKDGFYGRKTLNHKRICQKK